MHLLSEQEIIHRWKTARGKASSYRAFYSTWLDGITTDPAWMLVPIDDHMVHRGDAVFEAIKVKSKKIWLLDEHLDRLQRSSSAIGINWPLERARLKEVIFDACRVSGLEDAIIRLFLSRGPGGFTTNPYESVGSQVYVVITDYQGPRDEKYAQGLQIATTQLKVKQGFWAQIKSCNYLPNVMMKKEALDRGVDIVVGVDDEGFVTEGSTENIAYVSSEGHFCYPHFENTLRGTTLLRLAELLKAKGFKIQETKTKLADLLSAQSIYVVGTTWAAIPVKEFDGKRFDVTEHAKLFRELLEQDQLNNSISL